MEGIEERTTFAEVFTETARQMSLFWSNQEASVLEAFFDAGMGGLFLGYRLNFYVEARKPLSLADIGVTVIREYLWPAATDYEWSLYAGLADGLELTLVCREDLLSDAEARASLDGFVNVLDHAISDPKRTLGQIST